MQRALAMKVVLVVLASFVLPEIGIAESNRFTQVSMNFSSPRKYEWDYDRKRNTVILYLKKTNSLELENLDNYDESVIKRVVIRDVGGQDTEVKFFLRDRNLRASLSHFHEPFRILLDVFDTNYREAVDPRTGLPMVPNESVSNSGGSQRLARQSFETTEPQSFHRDMPPERQNLVPKKHQFLLPQQDISIDGEQAMAKVRETKGGVGTAWGTFPIYIYRLQAGLHLSDATQQMWIQKNSDKAQESPEALAEYAGKLFDFKHEYKALEAYKAVLKQKPDLFSEAPLHLWRLAEAHLGAGNLTLADGYFARFIEQFPQSKLHPLAKIRRIDIKAIRAIQDQNKAKFAMLAKDIDSVSNVADSEVQALVAIRKSYWEDSRANFDPKYIPKLSQRSHEKFTNALGGFESFQTEFLARSLLLNNMVGKKYPWSAKTGSFASSYFKKYKKSGNQDYSRSIKDKLRGKLESLISKLSRKKQFDKVIEVFGQLPKSLKSIRKTPYVAWYIAESYRKLGEFDEAIPLYGSAAKGADNNSNKFKSSLWQGVLAERVRQNASASSRKKLDAQIRQADKRMRSTWSELPLKEKKKLIANFKEPLTDAVLASGMLRTPAEVLLETWDDTLSVGDTGNNLSSKEFSPSANAFKTIVALEKHFKRIADKPRRTQAIKLIQLLRPSQFGSDNEAKDDWTNQIVKIAEEMRLENNLLEAGKMYVLAGRESENWENRAESLYKGGLLLYRSGRRKQAVEAFKEAAADGENQLYANLAKERLNRLSN